MPEPESNPPEALYVMDLRERAQTIDWAGTFDGYILPSNKAVPIAIDHFEYRADDPQSNEQRLLLLEKLVFTEKRKVLIVSTISPVFYFSNGGSGDCQGMKTEEHGEEPQASQSLNRWMSVLGPFAQLDFSVAQENDFDETVRKFKEKLAPPFEKMRQTFLRLFQREWKKLVDNLDDGVEINCKELIDEITIGTNNYWRDLWAPCSKVEKLVLVQLVKEGKDNDFETVRKFKEKLAPPFEKMRQAFVELVQRECKPSLRLRKVAKELVDNFGNAVEMTREELIDEIMIRTDNYWRDLASCSKSEKLVLVQLAKEGNDNDFKETVRKIKEKHFPPSQKMRQTLVELFRTEFQPSLQLRKIGKELMDNLDDGVEMTREELIDEIMMRTKIYYRDLWASCSKAEKLVMAQLAQEGLVNPENRIVVWQLMRKGLVVRDPVFRVMNESFRRFAAAALPPQTLKAWEQEGVVMFWGHMRAVLLTVALGAAAFLFITQQSLFETWMAYATGLFATIPAVVRLFGTFQKGHSGAHIQ